ncbi:MAG: type VI secretion system tube protein Hcp [Bacteroidota bacterium]
MKKITIAMFVAFTLFTCFSNVLKAQIYLKATGPGNTAILGESTAVGFSNQIDVSAYSQGIAGCPVITGGGSGACKTSVGTFTFMMRINRSIIPLKALALSGNVLPNVEVSFVATGGDGTPYTYYKIKMEDVIISSMQESGEAPEFPTFSVELRVKRIAWGYRRQNRDGSLEPFSVTGWDVSSNQPWVVNATTF